MPRKDLTTILICCAGILSIALFAVKLTAVEAEGLIQTWPSRTPTPSLVQTQPPPGSTPAGGGQATATGQSSPPALPPTVIPTTPAESPLSPTADRPAALGTINSETSGSEVSTSVDNETIPGVHEQTGECGVPSFIEALGAVSVRTGVRTNSEIVGYLQLADQRIIIGRSNRYPWWMILFDSEHEGWVSDQAVIVHGYTGDIPIIELAETSAEADSIWNPTPIPGCTPPALEPVSSVSTNLTTAAPEVTVQRSSSTQSSESANISSDSQNNSEIKNQLNQPKADDSTFTWLIVTAVFLVVAGVAILFIRRLN